MPAPAPAALDDDDALIPMPESDFADTGTDLEIDEDLLEDPPRAPVAPPRPAARSRQADPDATTEPELNITSPVRAEPDRPAPAVASEAALSEEDLAGLDTSDLDVAIEPMEEGESLFDTSGVDLSAGREPQD